MTQYTTTSYVFFVESLSLVYFLHYPPYPEQYASKATSVLRGALKEPARTHALARDAVSYNRVAFIDGKGLPKGESRDLHVKDSRRTNDDVLGDAAVGKICTPACCR